MPKFTLVLIIMGVLMSDSFMGDLFLKFILIWNIILNDTNRKTFVGNICACADLHGSLHIC